MSEEIQNTIPNKKGKWWKRLLFGFAVFLLLVIALAYGIFKSATFQTYLVQKIANYINKDHRSKISLEGVDIKFLDSALALDGVLVKDYRGDTLLFVNELVFDIHSFGIDKHFVDSRLLKLNQGLMDIKVYKGDTINTFSFFLSEWIDKNDTTPSPQWSIYSKQLALNKIDFRFSNENIAPTPNGVDFNHLDLKNINGEICSLRFAGDSLMAKISKLSLREKSGFSLYQLNAEVKNSSKELSLQNVDISFNRSFFKGNIAFKYNDYFAYADFINKVKMKILVLKSDVLMSDIGFFVPSLIGWNEHVKLQGTVAGRVSSLHLNDVFLGVGDNTILNGTVEMDGLPAIENTFIYADLHEFTSDYDDLSNLTFPMGDRFESIEIPAMVRTLGTINFSGEFTGFINEFVANGKLKTKLGEVFSDVQLSVNKKTGHRLDGYINVPSFELGRLLSNNLLGKVSVNGTTKINFGNSPNATFDGNIHSFDFNGYNYKHIKVDASAHDQYFAGVLSVKDKNLDFDFDGEVNVKRDSVVYNFNTRLNKANLTRLHLLDRDTSLSVSAIATVNLSGNSIDEIRGKAILDSVRWKEGMFDEDFGKVQFLTSQNRYGRRLDLSSKVADVSVWGDFSIEKLPDLVVHYFQQFAREVLPQKVMVQKNQNVNISFKIDDFKQIQRLFLPDVYLEKNTEALFRYSDKSGLLFDLYTDSSSFPGFNVKQVSLSSKPNLQGAYSLELTAEKIYPGNKIPLNHFDFKFTVAQNTADFTCDWNNDSDSLKNDAHIGANAVFKSIDSVSLNFNDTYFHLQNRLWKLNKENSIVWNSSAGEINNLQLSMNDKTLFVQGKLGSKDNDVLRLDFNGVSIEFLKLVLPSVKVTGSVTGNVDVASVLSNPKVNSSLILKDLVMNNQPFGETVINTSYSFEEQKIGVDLKVKRITGGNDADGYLLKLAGDYFPFKEKDQLNCEIDFKNFRISLLQPYFDGVLSGINKAKVYGKLNVTGELESPVVLGELQFKDFAPTIDYLNVAYDLNDKVYFKEDGIYFENFTVKAFAPYYNAVKNEGIGHINGVITHNRFHDFYFNLSIDAKKLMALNTDLSHNKNYYGKAFVSGDIMIGGSPSNIIMYANLSTEKYERSFNSVDYTVLVLPLDQQEDVPMFDFVEFANPKDTIKKVSGVRNMLDVPWLDMALDIHVTPDARVELIFDSRVGDEIIAQGNADMQFQINTNGKFTMNGVYEVEKGEYFFTVKNFLGKKFKVSQGGTVAWHGDPMEADVDLKALYTLRTRVSTIMDPIKYTPAQIEEMNTNVPVDVVMYMKGNLWKPTTSLDLELNNANAHATEIVADNIIGESEKAKQAVSLLMQGAFIIPDNSASGSSVLSAGLSNAGQFITGQVNNYLSQITGEAINVGFDYNGASDSLSTVSMNVSKNLYNDKLVVSGTFDLGKDASDMEVQYKITKDVTVKAFRKSQQNQKDQEGSVPTQGASVFIRKEFDTLKELFTRKKKEK
ncbi:MAG: translocation/assembly module TamB domain-containing protein [Flavobacteriales bacterium]